MIRRMSASEFGAVLGSIEGLFYERGRVYCTADAPWDMKRGPVTHTGTNDRVEDWNGGPAGYKLVLCEFCGGTKNIIAPPTAEELKWERDREILARRALSTGERQ